MEQNVIQSLFALILGLAAAAAAVLLLVWPVAKAVVTRWPPKRRKRREEDAGGGFFDFLLALVAMALWGFLFVIAWSLAVSFIPWQAHRILEIESQTGLAIGAGGAGCIELLFFLGKIAAGIRAAYLVVKRGFFHGVASLAMSLPLLLVAGMMLVSGGLSWVLLFFLAATSAGVSAVFLMVTDGLGRALFPARPADSASPAGEPEEEEDEETVPEEVAQEAEEGSEPLGEELPQDGTEWPPELTEDGPIGPVEVLPWQVAQEEIAEEAQATAGGEVVAEHPALELTELPPGHAAIDAILAATYPGREPKIWSAPLPRELAGPLERVVAILVPAPRSHWHYVSFGFTDRDGSGARPGGKVSGWGFELTLRLAGKGATPPDWPVALMQSLAREVTRFANPLAAGDHFDLNEPMPTGRETALTAMAVIVDPGLPPGESPYGPFVFLQLVGLTEDEREFLASWNGDFLKLAQLRDPLLVTDPGRASWLADPNFREFAEKGRGSSRPS